MATVPALGNVKCRTAIHVCQGTYHCENINPELLQDFIRFEVNTDDMEPFWKAEKSINTAEPNSVDAVVAACVFTFTVSSPALTIPCRFYNTVQQRPCPLEWTNNDGDIVKCDGRPQLRKYASGVRRHPSLSFIMQ